VDNVKDDSIEGFHPYRHFAVSLLYCDIYMYLISAAYIFSCPVFNFIFVYSYYQSTPENEPSQRHVYAVAADGSSAPYCLSCSVRTPEGRACVYASGSFSTNMSHVALTCSGPDPPHVSLYKMSSDSPLVVWEINESLRQKIEGRDLPKILDTEVVVAEGFTAKARLWLPPGADTSGVTKYPMLVYV